MMENVQNIVPLAPPPPPAPPVVANDPTALPPTAPSEQQVLSFQHNPPTNDYSLTTYIFNGDEYNYLKDDMLSRNFDTTLGGDKDVIFKVRFCIFKINDECKEPFLEFYVENKEKKLLFPSTEIPALIMQEGNATAIFERECCVFYQQIALNNEGTQLSEEIAQKTYRGFIEEENHTIYVFFDSTYVSIPLDDHHIWGILDEIVNEKHIGDSVMEKEIYDMVHRHEHIAYIKDSHGDRINMPCCLYLCTLNENGEYVNVFYDESETMRTTKSISEKKINHGTFGNYYFFTTDPIHNNDNIHNIKRFSVFIDNALYVLNINKDIQEIDFNTDDEEAEFDEVKTYKDYTCIYFFENGIQLWCIKPLSRFTEL